MRTYKITVSPAGNAQFGAFEATAPDDLITALCFVRYYGELHPH